MKKLLCILSAFAMTLMLVACGNEQVVIEWDQTIRREDQPMASSAPLADEEEETVTIYVTDTVTTYNADGTVMDSSYVVYETDWETKESFSAQVISNDGNAVVKETTTYGDKIVVTEHTNTIFSRIETRYNEQGDILSEMQYYSSPTDFERQENTYTYDDMRRVLSMTTTFYPADGSPAESRTTTYTYVNTENGSMGTADENGIMSILQYDQSNRLVQSSSIMGGMEVTRVETTYDAYGNTICSCSYINGQLSTQSEITYTAVVVSMETARRLPQFQRDN